MDFVFLIHSRDYTDIQRKFKFVRFFPKFIIELGCLYSPPFVVSKIKITNPTNNSDKVTGWIIGIPMTSKQILSRRKTANKKIIKAIKKAEKLGASIVGLGALTSPVTNAGMNLVDKTNLKITTGNTLTALVAVKHLEEILNKKTNLKIIAVVGGTGSTGEGIVKQLIPKFPRKEFHIFARTKKHLDNLLEEIKLLSPNARIKGFANDISKIKKADLVVIVTSASGAIVKNEHLKKRAIVYDITQPPNLNRDIVKSRPDILIYNGGLVETHILEGWLPFGLPKGVMFSCLGETIILALENYKKHFSLGKTKNDDRMKYINLKSKTNKIYPAKLKRLT